MSWSREKTRFGCEARNQSRSNSFPVRGSGSPSRKASRADASTTSDPTVIRPSGGGLGRARRRTVFTRVASSRGENGLVT